MMNTFFHSRLFHSVAVPGIVFLFLLPAICVAERPENMDLKALQARAAQLQQGLDKNPSDYDTLLSLGITYHALAQRDSGTYAKTAVRYLERAHQARFNDAAALCYLGSAYSLLSKDANDVTAKSNYANKGFEYMDKAVRIDPDNITVRMTRAGNAKNLPRFLNRRPIAYTDLEHVIGLLKRDPGASASLRATVYGALASLYAEDNDAAKAAEYRSKARRSEKEN